MRIKLMKTVGVFMLLLAAVAVGEDVYAQNHTIRRNRPTRQTRQTTPAKPQNSEATELEKRYQADLGAGEALFDEEKYEDARKHFMKMMAKYPKHKEDVNLWIEVCNTMLDEQASEKQAFEVAMAEAKALEDVGRYADAIPLYDKMLEDFPKYSQEIHEKRNNCIRIRNEQPFETVEEMPEFPGGNAALMKFISENLEYPQLAMEADIQGKVIVGFIVERDGSVSNVEVRRGVAEDTQMLLDKEAVRVVNLLPRWKPGKQNGIPVRVHHTIPIIFKLQGPSDDD